MSSRDDWGCCEKHSGEEKKRCLEFSASRGSSLCSKSSNSTTDFPRHEGTKHPQVLKDHRGETSELTLWNWLLPRSSPSDANWRQRANVRGKDWKSKVSTLTPKLPASEHTSHHDLAGRPSGILHRHGVVEDQRPQQPHRLPDGELRSPRLWWTEGHSVRETTSTHPAPAHER